MTFDKSCLTSNRGLRQPLYLFLQSQIFFLCFLAAAAPNTAAQPSSLQAPSLAPSMDSEEDDNQLYSGLKNRCNDGLFCIACDVELNSVGITLSAGRVN